ncbi:hypothetical protein GTU79_01860 [Sodalis ligni]|uniref:hypothetical protein n=1 Tax=Sodalis ligni TaxID=2697027 RepID=UPI001BDE38C8|nr:hypothetical protein [Sodalis ligni]QWA11592.1 hypothetical protein GTU79_01860 [Sodalis ligni]
MMTYEVNYSCLEPNRVGKANDDNGNNNPTFVKSLVGVSSSPCGEHFTMLPAEMVAEIMIRLPIVDVYRLANLTNTTWHQARFIISKRDALEKQELLRTVHSLNNSKALKNDKIRCRSFWRVLSRRR